MNRDEALQKFTPDEERKFVGLFVPPLLYFFNIAAPHKGVVEMELHWDVGQQGKNFVAGQCRYITQDGKLHISARSTAYPNNMPSDRQFNQLVDVADIHVENW